MALATDPRPQPNLEIYDFESQFEDAFQQAIVARNLKPADVQQGDGHLKTPRIECQFTSGQQAQRSYIVPGTDTNGITAPQPTVTQVAYTGGNVNAAGDERYAYWVSMVTARGETAVGTLTQVHMDSLPNANLANRIAFSNIPASVTAVRIWRSLVSSHSYDMSGFPVGVALLASVNPEDGHYDDFESTATFTARASGVAPVKTIPTLAWTYPNVWDGILRVKVITNRKKQGRAVHRQLRGLVRWMMQQHDIELSDRMKYLTVIKSIESGSVPEFNQGEEDDISGMSYAITFNIKPTAFPTPS